MNILEQLEELYTIHEMFVKDGNEDKSYKSFGKFLSVLKSADSKGNRVTLDRKVTDEAASAFSSLSRLLHICDRIKNVGLEAKDLDTYISYIESMLNNFKKIRDNNYN